MYWTGPYHIVTGTNAGWESKRTACLDNDHIIDRNIGCCDDDDWPPDGKETTMTGDGREGKGGRREGCDGQVD